MSSNTIRFGAYLDDKVSSSLDRIRDKFDQLGGKGSAASLFGNVGAKAVSAGFSLITEAADRAGEFLVDIVKKGLAAEESTAHLATSLRASVPAWDGNVAAIDDVIKAHERLGFSDTEQRNSLASLVPVTHDVSKAFRVQAVAMDLARFKHISLAEATDALVKVEAGRYRILNSLGIKLAAHATAEQALTAVEAIAQGQAESFANTTEGKLVGAQTKLDGVMERLGEKTLPLVANAADAVSNALDTVIPIVDGIATAGGKAADALNFLSGADKTTGESTDLLGDKTTALGQALHWLAAQPGVVVDMINQTSDATRAAAASFDYMSGHVKDDMNVAAVAVKLDGQDIGGYVDLIGHKALSAEGQLAAAMTGMVSDVRTAKTELAKAGSEAANSLWDPQIAKLNEYKNAREINDLQIRINSGKLNAKELLDAQIQIDTLKRDRIGLLATLADAGDKAAQQDLLRMAKVALGTKTTTADQRAYWQTVIDKLGQLGVAIGGIGLSVQAADYQATKLKDDLYKLPGISGPGNLRYPGRAGGGPVSAGTAYTVGEMGSETFIPATNGTIIPHGQATASQPTVHTQIYLDGRIIADVVDEHLGRRYALRGSAAFSLGGA